MTNINMPIREVKVKETSILYLFLMCLLKFIFCILARRKCDFCTSLQLSMGSKY